MSFPRDAYPYTNFHELNLGYFIVHFREIFSQWADLYDQMLNWKDATDEELATWKAGVEADLDQREAALRAELETWKAQTGQDIAGWEDATLAALTAWQTATQAVFEAIRVEAAGSASAAAASAGDAATAKTAAETAQAAAEAAAASVQASAAQITTNTEDIADLKTQLMFSVSQKVKIDQGYYGIADGIATNSNLWCRTTNFVNKDAVFKTSTLKMYLLAYNVDGTYIGAWNGTEFTNVYEPSSYVKEITFKEWAYDYPSYQFKVDFYNAGNSVTPSEVLSDLQTKDYSYNEIDFLNNEIDFLKSITNQSSLMESDVTGECKFSPDDFTQGTLTDGELLPSYKYRVSMKAITSFPYDVTVVVKNGFRVSVNLFTDGSYTGYAGWITTEYQIPANQEFKLMIARTVEDTSEIAVVDEFVNNIYIKSLVGFLDDVAFKSEITGERSVNSDYFTHGSLTQGELYPSYKYRVSMKEIMSFPFDVHIIAKTGFRLSINLFTDGTYTGFAGWTSDYVIQKNQQFRIMIARTTDNTSEIADIAEFVSNLYVKTLALETAETVAGLQLNGNLVNALTSGFRYIYHFGMASVTERTETAPVIPSQSIYDVRNAKNLGFACIECNVHKTSDGKYVVTHGVEGKLGHDFDDLNGDDAGDQNVVISQNTLSDLQTNYRYRSSNSNYRVPITTLEEFLAECAKVDIKVMQMYCDDTSMNIGINIMGNHRIWFYSAPRSAYKGPITNWRKLTTKAEIVADCESYGLPYVYSMGNPTAFTESELKDIAQTLHSMGYQLMTAYQTNVTMNNLASYGWDYFILGDNSIREPVIINGKQINFNQDGSVTWAVVTP